jgi:hypothetical protein
MSKKGKNRPMRARPRELSIARALASLSSNDEAALCAFIEEAEKNRLYGDSLSAWRVTRHTTGWILECRTMDGTELKGQGEDCTSACHEISGQLIAEGTKGAAQA